MPNLTILTGAGISAESGIPTFRDTMGLWEMHDVEDVATPAGFTRNPGLVHDFYNERRRKLADVEPNAAHKALAELQAGWAGRGTFTLVTQNIDDLHERGGSTRVLHMHGLLKGILCSTCGEHSPHHGDHDATTVCPACNAPGGARPDVVWFGEIPYHLEAIYDALDQTDIFLCIGSSGEVAPANMFAAASQRAGMRRSVDWQTIEINPSPSHDPNFSRVIAKAATIGVPELVAELLG